MKIIVVAKDFSDTPGGRFKKDGPNSGEQFREEVLKPALIGLNESEKIRIDFDGAYGYPTSFLEEAFGGLARQVGAEELLAKVDFKSDEEPNLIEEIKRYIRNAPNR
ncbi:STAS-like domain-containing protein [Patescibacteria group bacterium]|nr:STAS-like domain-containing protein [Patescibacteria group bacterium]